jgi:hypothetical protein
MARVAKKPSAAEVAVAEHVAAVVAANPRGAPITLSVDNPTPLVEDALNGPPPPAPLPAPPKVKEPFCILDDQPINSVLVVLQEDGGVPEPWLQTPNGKVDVPRDDLAWKLPLMGEIKRTGQHSFVAIQRDDQLGKPKLVCSTAVEACRLFKKHFHNERD